MIGMAYKQIVSVPAWLLVTLCVIAGLAIPQMLFGTIGWFVAMQIEAHDKGKEIEFGGFVVSGFAVLISLGGLVLTMRQNMALGERVERLEKFFDRLIEVLPSAPRPGDSDP